MARTQANLKFGVFDGLRGLSVEAKILYFALLVEPTINQAGIGALRERRWARDTELPLDALDKALRELDEKRYVLVDEDTDEILIRTLIRNDGVAEKPNLLWAACRAALMLKSPRLREALASELRRLPSKPAPTVGKNGRSYEHPDPHATADAIDPEGPPKRPGPEPSSNGSTAAGASPDAESSSNGSRTVQQAATNRSRTTGGGGGGGGESPSVGGSSGTTPRKRGTRIPEDFAKTGITPELVAWAREKCPLVDGPRETEMFVNYWSSVPGAKGLKLDWARTWRNRMMEQQQRAEQQKSRSHLRLASGGSHRADPANGVFWEQ